MRKTSTSEILAHVVVGAALGAFVYTALAHGALSLLLWALPGWTEHQAESYAFGIWETHWRIEAPIGAALGLAWSLRQLWRSKAIEAARPL